MLQDAYSLHEEKVRGMLRPHSALPPVRDLSKPLPAGQTKDLAFERYFKGYFVAGTFTDPGISGPAQATSTATKFLDVVGPIYGLPARGCEAAVIARVAKVEARIDDAHSFIYARYSLDVSGVFKGTKKRGIREGATVFAAGFGGTIHFPSGHVETFILASHGFLEQGKEYITFLWKPHRSENTYFVAEPYLIQDGAVFAIEDTPGAVALDGMPLSKFEAKVKAAVAKNIDTD